jgi:hypothetical protein
MTISIQENFTCFLNMVSWHCVQSDWHFFVYRYDMVDRERWTMLLLAVILGMAGCRFIGYVEDYLFLRFGFGITQNFERAVLVAVCEELFAREKFDGQPGKYLRQYEKWVWPFWVVIARSRVAQCIRGCLVPKGLGQAC